MPRTTDRRASDGVLVELLASFGATIVEATTLLREVVHDHPDAQGAQDRLVAAEHEADRIAHDLLHRLAREEGRGRTIGVEDGHRLVTALDDIVDDAEAAGDMLSLYRVEAPTDQAQVLADLLVRSGEAVAEALRRIDDGEALAERLVEIHRLENEADRVHRDAVASLFEAGVDPMVVIRWKDVYGALESAIDACETVAHVLEGIDLKRRA